MPEHIEALEHMSYLIFMKKLEDYENNRIIAAKKSKKEYSSIFENNENKRWSVWKNYPAEKRLQHIRETVFPFLKNLKKENSRIKLDLGDSYFEIKSPILLEEAVNAIDDLKITQQNLDSQGDIYEYMTSHLKTAGLNGQFRTPRHIIRMMVEILDPKIGQTICDPACGTGGFLINSYLHILKQNTSEDLIKYDQENVPHNLIGDKLTDSQRNFLMNKQFFGFDFSNAMIQISQMNMILHGFTQPQIQYANSLGKQFNQEEEFDVIFANPPFSGNLNKSEINDDFRVETNSTELLFMELFYNKLVVGGQAVVIVPTGALYGTDKAHKNIRKLLLENCRIDAIISMPSGIFRPYTGQATSILFFTKGEKTKEIWFYVMENDGFKLDTNHNKLIKENDIPDILQKIKTKLISEKSWIASFDEIKEKKWNLDAARYKPIKKELTPSSDPIKLLDEIKTLEEDIVSTVDIIKKDIQDLE